MRAMLFLFLLSSSLLSSSLAADERVVPARLPSGEIQLPNGRLLTPTGTQTPVGAYPFGMAITPDGTRVVVASTGAGDQTLHLLEAKSGKLLDTVGVDFSWLGLAVAPDGARAYLAGAKKQNVLVWKVEGDHVSPVGAIPVRSAGQTGDATPSGLAVSHDGASLWVARMLLDDVVRIDLATKSITASIGTGHHPYRPALSPDGRVLAVSNWGASSVTLIDTGGAHVVGTVMTDDHPCDLVFSPDGKTLFVAQANRNRVAAVDVAARKVVRQISVGLGPDGPGSASAEMLPDGSTPNALALSRDGRTLFVANADDDAVAVVDVPKDPRGARAAGFIPSGWYPDALALTPDGRTLFIANGKGSGSRANAADGPNPLKAGGANPSGHVKFLPGSISRVPVPGRAELAKLTARAYANRKPASRGVSPARPSKVLPSKPGESSPVKHVIYVIRENRTYDQVFGDLPRGNGEPSLAIFGRNVTPNSHALAETFVLLDNFYADAEVSADGHNWSMAAYATDFTEKTWVPYYGSRTFDYWWEGDDPNAAPTAGYLWDAASKAGLPLRNYGEFVGVGSESEAKRYTGIFEGKTPVLKENTCPFYPGFDLDILDNARVDLWLKEFHECVAKKSLPSLMIVRLGNDHTSGTKKGARTPRAAVAENDVALGRVVEALSKSPFWKETAIFVVEDDAQNGSDHVDAHRTVALVISPYTRRGGFVDSTLYSTTSMLRTMEAILGLPPMSQHDASATVMSNAFRDEPDTTPFVHLEAEVPLFETNPDGAPMQAQAAGWDFSRADAAPDRELNESIWKSVKGADAVMPAPVNAGFVRAVEEKRRASEKERP